MDIQARIDRLSRELLHHQYLYYVLAEPVISDAQYDQLFDELQGLEAAHPELAWENSPTRRVGSDLDNSFPEKAHTIPVLSLDKVYQEDALLEWMEKTCRAAGRELGFVVEEKIDGASIVLYYREGRLQHALTRGNGEVGNDVSANVRTIRQVPLAIEEGGELAVRGEIYLPRAEFAAFNAEFENKYANPRNLAAGSLRNLKSALVARVPLRLFCYEGFFAGDAPLSHLHALQRLQRAGFPLNRRLGFFCDDEARRRQAAEWFPAAVIGPRSEIPAFIAAGRENRAALPYEIDGLVVKVDELAVREELGVTAHHPRWAVAVKFDAPLAETELLDIQIQIGRNGRVSPVAVLKPVKLSGSSITRATLHNQDYIDLLELGIGDRVSISKRGDVIPAVEEVVEKDAEHPSIFRLPSECPFCRSLLVREGGHHFCRNEECPERRKRLLIHFAAKDQMDIDTLGEKTLSFLFDQGWVRDPADLYEFDFSRLLGQEGFKEKKVANIQGSIARSKSQPFARVLTALGLEGLGASAAQALLAGGFTDIERILEAAAREDEAAFAAIEGIGAVTAAQLIRHFRHPRHIELIGRLQGAGLCFQAEAAATPLTDERFRGQTWVITGTFAHFQPREKAAEEIRRRGGQVAAGISGKTTHLLLGAEPGSKLQKAQAMGVTLVDEAGFLALLDAPAS